MYSEQHLANIEVFNVFYLLKQGFIFCILPHYLIRLTSCLADRFRMKYRFFSEQCDSKLRGRAIQQVLQ